MNIRNIILNNLDIFKSIDFNIGNNNVQVSFDEEKECFAIRQIKTDFENKYKPLMYNKSNNKYYCRDPVTHRTTSKIYFNFDDDCHVFHNVIDDVLKVDIHNIQFPIIYLKGLPFKRLFSIKEMFEWENDIKVICGITAFEFKSLEGNCISINHYFGLRHESSVKIEGKKFWVTKGDMKEISKIVYA